MSAVIANHGKRRRFRKAFRRSLVYCAAFALIDGHVHRCGRSRGHVRSPHLISGQLFENRG